LGIAIVRFFGLVFFRPQFDNRVERDYGGAVFLPYEGPSNRFEIALLQFSANATRGFEQQ